MPASDTARLRIIASWPLLIDERFDPNQPSPWRANNIEIPSSPSPLQPTLSVLFTHGLKAEVYSNPTHLAQYIFLTSLTDPTATNITNFIDVAYDAVRNLLTFRPAEPLAAGSTYQVTVRGTLPDVAGRLLGSSYSWEFSLDPDDYQGLPIPVLISPTDQSVAPSLPVKFRWNLDPDYTAIPDGLTVASELKIYADPERKHLVWSGIVYPS